MKTTTVISSSTTSTQNIVVIDIVTPAVEAATAIVDHLDKTTRQMPMAVMMITTTTITAPPAFDDIVLIPLLEQLVVEVEAEAVHVIVELTQTHVVGAKVVEHREVIVEAVVVVVVEVAVDHLAIPLQTTIIIQPHDAKAAMITTITTQPLPMDHLTTAVNHPPNNEDHHAIEEEGVDRDQGLEAVVVEVDDGGGEGGVVVVIGIEG